jgi:ankyrin repeat protein
MLKNSISICAFVISCSAGLLYGMPPGPFHNLNVQLLRAAESGDCPDIQACLQKGASLEACDDQGRTALYFAAAQGNAVVVNVLLASKLGVNVNISTTMGETSLHAAVRGGSNFIVNLLLARGARPNSVSHTKKTPLSLALWYGNREIAASLYNAGARPITAHEQNILRQWSSERSRCRL